MKSILSISNYDLFEMPGVFSRAKPRDWNEADALEYHQWLLSVKAERVGVIMDAAGVNDSTPREVVLREISNLLKRSLGNLATTSEAGQVPNGLGLLASFDAALVVGDYLVEDDPNAQWCIMRSSDKLLITRNLTVVRRRLSMGFEPFLEGRRILTLLERRAKDYSSVLQFKYDCWMADLKLDTLGDR